ncbi:unnamed protein product [Linum trigynum]|uniref:DUF4283 domain-containing protein n=1 Tax=Linum trigynum TaxID=586398 RepID=A0AAV2EUH5_9ROSI
MEADEGQGVNDDHTKTIPKESVWKGAAARLFSDVTEEEGWYVADSDSEDVASREKEEDDFIPEEEKDPTCPTVLFSAAQKIRWRREWRSALVVRGLGRKVPYLPLARRLNFLWARHGKISISDMKNSCFLVKFKSKLDYELATYGGPWMMGDTYLAVHRWFKGFNPWTSEITSTMVWVQLPDLPVEFINKEAVLLIADLIGRPVRVDRATEEGARAKFARVCVEVDLTRPLLSMYKVEGSTYLIQYEGLENICNECGRYGEAAKNCDCKRKAEVEVEEVEMVPETQMTDPTEGKVYGEWMTVKRRERRYNERAGKNEAQYRGRNQNRYQVLNEANDSYEEPSVGGGEEEGGAGSMKGSVPKSGEVGKKEKEGKQNSTGGKGEVAGEGAGEGSSSTGEGGGKAGQKQKSGSPNNGSKSKEQQKKNGNVVSEGVQTKGIGGGQKDSKRMEIGVTKGDQTRKGSATQIDSGNGAGNRSPLGHK